MKICSTRKTHERGEVCAWKVIKEVEGVTEEEVKTALKKMKKGKTRGPADILVEVWLILGDVGIEWLTKLMNKLLKGKRCQMNGGNVY